MLFRSQAQVSVTGGAYSLNYYRHDISNDSYSQTHTVNYTGTGLPNGLYDVTIDVNGVPTLTLAAGPPPSAGGSGFMSDLVRDSISDLVIDLVQ